MGAGNSKESLHDAINAENSSVITQILKQFPQIINEPVSEQNPTTPLGRAAWRGNVELLYTLLEHGADVNFVGPQGVSPLQWASQRGKDEAVDFLVQKGAKLDYVSKDNMNALDYAVLYGSYNTAWKLMNLGLNPRDVDYYVAMAKEKHVLFHDYALMIEHLNLKTPLEECPPFDQAPPEPQMKDPVIDPRETWGQFAKRILEFEEPPLVERDSLPEELRPENRALGRLRSYFNGLSPYPEQQGIERADVAEANQDDNISDPKHIEVDIPKEKVKDDDHVEKKDFDDNSVNLKVDEDEGNKTIERAFRPEPEPESAVRKESDIPNQSADVLIKPLQATQIRVGSKKNLHDSASVEKQDNQIEVVDS